MVLEKVFDIGAVTDIFSVHFTFYVLVQNIFYIMRWYDFFFLFISYLDSDMKLGLGLIISPLNVLRRLFIFCRQTSVTAQ